MRRITSKSSAVTKLGDEIRLPRAWDTAAGALCACARALGDPRGVHEVAAASGLAFRTSLDAQLTLAGPHAYPWREELMLAAERLGYACEAVASSPSDPPGSTPHHLARLRALALIERGLHLGRPSLIWGVHAPEFGLARGLHGELLEVSGILDGMAPPELPVHELGHGDVPMVLALQLTAPLELPPEEAALATLRAALHCGRGPTPTLHGFITGLSAWAALAKALESGTFDPAGLAYAAQRYAEARACVAGWLDSLPSSLDLAPARAAYRRSAGMLAELASCHPFPPQPDTLLTSTVVDQARALVEEIQSAERAGLDAIESALTGRARRRADSLRVVDLDAASLPSLFACAGDLPIPLAAEVDACREALRPRIGTTFRGKLLYDGDRLIGHLLYAPLAEARYPVVADGDRWFVFCPWLLRDLRGHGLGARLFAALEAEARQAGIDGLLTVGTTDERFLYPASLERQGFQPLDRKGDRLLLERTFTDRPSHAHLLDPSPVDADGALPVHIRHGHNCPLLLHTRRNLAASARALGLRIDEATATTDEPTGATIAGKPLAHGFVPLAALTAALKDERARW